MNKTHVIKYKHSNISFGYLFVNAIDNSDALRQFKQKYPEYTIIDIRPLINYLKK